MSVYCVRSWSSLYETPVNTGGDSSTPNALGGSGGQSTPLDGSVSAGEDLLARFGLTNQLRELRSRSVPDKYRSTVDYLPRGAVDSCLSDRRLQKTLRELLKPLPEDFHTGFPQDPDQNEHTMKWIASKAPPANTLGPIDMETITPEAISALGLSDSPLVLNPIKSRSKRHVSQAGQQQTPQGNVPQGPSAVGATPVTMSPAAMQQMPNTNASLGTKRPHDAVTPGDQNAPKRARTGNEGVSF